MANAFPVVPVPFSLSALSLLMPGEMCVIFLTDGTKRTGKWNPLNRGFHLCDDNGVGFVSKEYVQEWMAAPT